MISPGTWTQLGLGAITLPDLLLAGLRRIQWREQGFRLTQQWALSLLWEHPYREQTLQQQTRSKRALEHVALMLMCKNSSDWTRWHRTHRPTGQNYSMLTFLINPELILTLCRTVDKFQISLTDCVTHPILWLVGAFLHLIENLLWQWMNQCPCIVCVCVRACVRVCVCVCVCITRSKLCSLNPYTAPLLLLFM